jgi:DNA polymerase-1
MQGTAADIIKKAMLHIDDLIKQKSLRMTMIMQVHDELVFEVHKKELESAKDLIRNAMTNAAKITVPLVVDIGAGDNWDEAH